MSVLKENFSELEGRFRHLCDQVLPPLHLSLYDLEYNASQGALRVFIFNEKSSTAQIDDCVSVDHALTPYIDSEAWVPERLTLEVSSPGLDRHLNKRWHFEAVKGKTINLLLKDKVDERFKGNMRVLVSLKEVGKDDLIVDYLGNEIIVPFESIKKANLSYS